MSGTFKLLRFGGPFSTPPAEHGADLYYRTHCSTYVLYEFYPGPVHHNANTTVRFACLAYTIHSVVVCVGHRSRVPSETHNFHNDCSGSARLADASIHVTHGK